MDEILNLIESVSECFPTYSNNYGIMCEFHSEVYIFCSWCELTFSTGCATATEATYRSTVSGELDGFHWSGRSGKKAFQHFRILM